MRAKCILLQISVYILVAGCDSESETRAVDSNTNRSDVQPNQIQIEADKDWHRLISGPEIAATQINGERNIEYFYRQVELANQYRREVGLKFWKDYPDDPRRYQWLMMTTHLAPYYPQDIHEWTKVSASSWLGAEYFDDFDDEKRSRWDKEYAQLRNEFWNADKVNERMRRYLWFGELRQRLVSARSDPEGARGNSLNQLLKDILNYLVAYQEPFSVADTAAFEWSISELLKYLIKHADDIALTANQRRRFHSALTKENLSILDDWSLSNDPTWPDFLSSKPHPIQNQGADACDAAWLDLNSVPLHQQFDIPAASAVSRHEREFAYRRIRDQGLVLWTECPDNQHRLSWLHFSLLLNPAYPRNFTGYVDGNIGVHDDNYNEELNHIWQTSIAQPIQDILKQPTTSDLDIAEILRLEIQSRLMRAQNFAGTRYAISRETVDSILHDTLRLHKEFAEAESAIGSQRDWVYNFVATIINNHEVLGLSSEDLKTFLVRVRELADTRLTALVDGWSTSRSAEGRTNVVQLSLPTLSGRDFDLTDLQGNIVLLDFWATTCAACIEAFPRIHDVYIRFRERGFEVVSIGFDARVKGPLVTRIKDELELTWTTLVADDHFEELTTRFGFGRGVPQYLLLDRSGRIFADTHDIDEGRNLEVLLEEMLAAEVAEKDAATVH